MRGLVGQRNCRNYFRDNCTNAAGATALQDAFDNANVYLRPVDDNIFGEMETGGNNIAFNLRAYRVGRYMLATTLLHEMFHTCDPTGAGNAAELSAENAVETCRLHTPWIDSVSPRRGPVGSRVTIRGWNFGPSQGATDRVRFGGVDLPMYVNFHLYNQQGVCVFDSASSRGEQPRGIVEAICRIPGNLLNDDKYSIRFMAHYRGTFGVIVDDALVFEINDAGREGTENYDYGKWAGIVRPRLDWRIGPAHSIDLGSG